jgi:hypothetical protein
MPKINTAAAGERSASRVSFRRVRIDWLRPSPAGPSLHCTCPYVQPAAAPEPLLCAPRPQIDRFCLRWPSKQATRRPASAQPGLAPAVSAPPAMAATAHALPAGRGSDSQRAGMALPPRNRARRPQPRGHRCRVQPGSRPLDRTANPGNAGAPHDVHVSGASTGWSCC